ncbi:MmgE/PrpD family protein [Pseudorhizobium pelagicum]|uniref:2-methylcitrate dehydratase n=1 Tax=Pseudorhizobium pelagicum TaxID=1509405 RepID=A0A922P3Q9_9HYPH|nr:MmgE/PrpD family protein [Pseudorhizobium pelagicum]KEQ03701.1 hypothetical protein GV67_12625 [Pseudorhizobium pelagicum]KEQ08244.1 hypothetical protein GV68_02780 [Pseudorhizobium pelagicum]
MNDMTAINRESSIASLAKWTLAAEPAYVSDLALRQAELLTLDSVACAYSARNASAPRRVAAMIDELGSKPACTLIGHSGRGSVLDATFLNCALVRSQDFNDVQFIQKDGKLHIGGHCSDVLAAALAVGEAQGARGQDVLAAIIMGYELFRRLRDLMPMDSVWDGASAVGVVAAAMAGRIMGLDEARQANALALALARCATPSIVRYGELSGAKNMVGALLAREGVQLTLLAAKGMTGPQQVLDHRWGMQEVFDPALGFERLWAPIDELFILRSHVKTFACIGTAQASIVAALNAHRLLAGRVSDIEAIDVIMADLPIIRKQQAEKPRLTPSTHETADHSFTFLPAVVLMDGELTERQYVNERWAQPETRALTAKVRLSVSEELRARSPEAMPCQIRVHLAGGEVIQTECLYPPGHSFPDRGLAREPVVEKFKEVTETILTGERQARIIEEVLDLRNKGTVGPTISLLSI